MRIYQPLCWIVLFALALARESFAQILIRDIPAATANSGALCWDGSGFWCGANNSASIYKISEDDGTRLDTLVGPVNGCDGLAFDGSYLWWISGVQSRQRIYKIHPVTGIVVDSIPDPAQSYAGGLSWDGTYLWVTRYFPAQSIVKIDTADGAVVQTLAGYGEHVWGIANEQNYLWQSSADSAGDNIFRLNAATGALNWQFELPEHQSLPDRRIRGVAWVDGFLWVIAYAQDSNNNRVLQYDVSNALFPDIVLLETSHEFGAHVVGFPTDWSFGLTNIGNAELILSSAPLGSGQAFELESPANFPIMLSAFDTVSFTVRFAPPAAGTFVDSLFILSNDPDEAMASVRLRGTGLPNEGDIQPSPSSVDFGEVWIPNPTLSSSRPIQVLNQGSGVLTVSSAQISNSNHFRLDPIAFPMEIDSHSFRTIRVWFEPEQAGDFDAILSISSDDPDEPMIEIPLAGAASYAAFDSADVIWIYQDDTGEFFTGINALTWIEDVNGDGGADVIACGESGLTICLNGRSTNFGDTLWTFNTRRFTGHSGEVYYERALSTIDDITGDGIDDVILGTAGGSMSVYALSGETGDSLWMFDTEFWGVGAWVNDVQGVPDLNGDGVSDVIAAVGGGDGSGPRRVFALDGQDGSLVWEGPVHNSFYACTIVNDVTGDGIRDVVGGGTSWTVGINAANGAQLWLTSIGTGSPVFDLEPMGNANPEEDQTEDVVVASAYLGVYSIDGGSGEQHWLHPFDDTWVYEVEAGSDVTEDGVREVYVGTVGGDLVCLDGYSGAEIWTENVDPGGSENVLSLTAVPDVTGDGMIDLICGTLGDYLVVIDGWDGVEYFATMGDGDIGAVDATGFVPDLDGSGRPEILLGNRDGMIICLSGGGIYVSADPVPPAPLSITLLPAYPNPFNPVTRISYTLPKGSQMELCVFDVLGREVATLVKGYAPAGIHSVSWSARNNAQQSVGSGTYFVRLSTPGQTVSQRLVLLR